MAYSYTLPSPTTIVLSLNGSVLAHATGYSVRTHRACHAVECFGSAAPVAIIPQPVRYTLELERLLWDSEAVDFNTFSNFSVDITRCGKKITFSGCHWVTIEESSRNSLLWENAVLWAAGRTEVAV